ncbi:pyrroline-5-carboxylate reductase [Bosea sp. NPDC055332]
MIDRLPKSLVLVGAGKMGGAMLRGWLRVGLNPTSITIVDPHADDEMVGFASHIGLGLNPSTSTAPDAEVVVLATKPQTLEAVASTVRVITRPSTLVISVLAGKTIDDVSRIFPANQAIVRAMPNLPASVQRGVTAAVAGLAVTGSQRTVADALLSGIGKVEWLDSEELIDAATAVSGSGPAYVFYMVECLAAAAREAGLPSDVAERLARATIEGAGELLFQSAVSSDVLRQNVTSPGGTTAAALSILMSDDQGLMPLMRKAVFAAKRRAGELAIER